MKQIKFRLTEAEYEELARLHPGYGGISDILRALVRAYLVGRITI